MALTRWEPRNSVDLRNEIDQLFNRFWRRNGNTRDFLITSWQPSAEVSEHDDAYVISADLPGVDRDKIKVQMVNNRVTISGERQSEIKDEEAHTTERSYGKFSRSFSLPSAVDEDEISATYKDGVLTVTVPKTEASKAKQIAVK